MPGRLIQTNVSGSKDLRVRQFEQKDLQKLSKLRREIGVHDCSSCFRTFSAVDPDGILVAQNNKGEIVGACSSVRQSDDLFFVGLYCVREDYRGNNMGQKIWKLSDQHVGSSNAGLNAVPGKLEVYRDKCGYPIVETDFKCVKNLTESPADPKALSGLLPTGVVIEPYHPSHLPSMVSYDTALVGHNRERILSLNCKEKNSRTVVALQDGVCVGFGTVKLTVLGAARVGPLYADDPEVAEVMLKCLVASMRLASSFAMNTLSTNEHSKKMLAKLECPQIQELTRMYRFERLVVDTQKIYALFDLNFTAF